MFRLRIIIIIIQGFSLSVWWTKSQQIFQLSQDVSLIHFL